MKVSPIRCIARKKPPPPPPPPRPPRRRCEASWVESNDMNHYHSDGSRWITGERSSGASGVLAWSPLPSPSRRLSVYYTHMAHHQNPTTGETSSCAAAAAAAAGGGGGGGARHTHTHTHTSSATAMLTTTTNTNTALVTTTTPTPHHTQGSPLSSSCADPLQQKHHHAAEPSVVALTMNRNMTVRPTCGAPPPPPPTHYSHFTFIAPPDEDPRHHRGCYHYPSSSSTATATTVGAWQQSNENSRSDIHLNSISHQHQHRSGNTTHPPSSSSSSPSRVGMTWPVSFMPPPFIADMDVVAATHRPPLRTGGGLWEEEAGEILMDGEEEEVVERMRHASHFAWNENALMPDNLYPYLHSHHSDTTTTTNNNTVNTNNNNNNNNTTTTSNSGSRPVVVPPTAASPLSTPARAFSSVPSGEKCNAGSTSASSNARGDEAEANPSATNHLRNAGVGEKLVFSTTAAAVESSAHNSGPIAEPANVQQEGNSPSRQTTQTTNSTEATNPSSQEKQQQQPSSFNGSGGDRNSSASTSAGGSGGGNSSEAGATARPAAPPEVFRPEELEDSLTYSDFVGLYHALATLGLHTEMVASDTTTTTTRPVLVLRSPASSAEADADQTVEPHRANPTVGSAPSASASNTTTTTMDHHQSHTTEKASVNSSDGVSPARETTTFTVIDMDHLKELYRELVKKLHPDVAGGDAVRMEAVNTAYQQLRQCTSVQRAGYFYWAQQKQGLQRMREQHLTDMSPVAAVNAAKAAEEEEAARASANGKEGQRDCDGDGGVQPATGVMLGGFYLTILCISLWWGVMQNYWRACESVKTPSPSSRGSTSSAMALFAKVLPPVCHHWVQQSWHHTQRGAVLLYHGMTDVVPRHVHLFAEEYVQRVFCHRQLREQKKKKATVNRRGNGFYN